MKNVLLPSEVITKIESYISEKYPTLTTQSNAKLFKTLLDLWFYIYNKHISTTKDKDFDRSKGVLKYWCNISCELLKPFRIKIDKTLLIYSSLLDILVKAEVLEINESYSNTKVEHKAFSKSYRPDHRLDYNETTFIDIDLDTFTKDFKTKDKLIKENKDYKKLINSIYKTHIDLPKFFFKLDSLLGKVYNSKKEDILTPEISYRYKILAIKVNLGLHFFSVSNEGRVYTSIANLPSLMIPFLTLNGKKIKEIDAANSQPLLLSNLVNCPEYKNACENGLFYEKAADKLNMTRQEFKIMSYEKIFFNEKQIKSELCESLDAVYPNLSAQINDLKKEVQIWKVLQKMESDIWIKVANSYLFPVLTRHDSILVWEENVEQVKADIKEEYSKLGLKVTLK